MASPHKTPKPSKVFVVHGRNEKARLAMFAFLRALRLQPVEWHEAVLATRKPSPYVGEILEAAFAISQAFVVLMTPDDEARLRATYVTEKDPLWERELTPQPRPNVLFEAGMAMGQFADRTVIVELGNLREFSDIKGRHVIRMNDTRLRRQELALRLQVAGCPVSLQGERWRTAGKFDRCLSS